MKRVLLLVLALGLMLPAWAQDRTITGKVISGEADSSPLPGVNVIIKGDATSGTITDIDGNFKLTVPASATTLIFSYIGFQTQEVAIGSNSELNITLQSDDEVLQEVIVVGYGTATKQSFAGSLTQVDAELVNRKSISNISQALAGEVAGVNVINTTGQPGASATVRIRGIGSINGNSDPLYVVDGVPYYGSINAINPADIESMTVLKDATATAIYGSRGANGVILVNTKKGASGQTYIEVDTKIGRNVSSLPRYSKITSPDEYIAIGWDNLRQRGIQNEEADPIAYANAALFDGGTGVDPFYNMWNVADGGELIDPATGMVRPGVTRKYDPENWEDYAFQNSTRQETNLRIGGGDAKTNYFTSVGYLKDIGYSINSDFERLSARVNVNHQAKEWLSGGFNVGYSRGETNNAGQTEDSGSIFWFVDNIPSIYPLFLRDENGDKIDNQYYGGSVYDYGEKRGFGGLTNAISDAEISIFNRITHDLNGNANINIDFTKNLTFESRFGWQFRQSDYQNLDSPFFGPGQSANGTLFKSFTQTNSYNFTNLLRYNKDFGSHSLEALAAHESNKWTREYSTASIAQLVDPFGTDLNNGVANPQVSGYTEGYAIESYFGQVNYDYNDTYYVTGSIRADGSSRFVNDKWGTFGSIGAAWVISNESFLDVDAINFLKLKTSYGITGDQGQEYYPGYDLFEITNLNGTPSLTFDTKGNPDLTWETAKMFQAGVEGKIGKFLDFGIDYYNKSTDNLIFDRRVGPSLGYAIITVNDGKLVNSGIEFDFTGHILNKTDFYLDLRVNGEILSNELTQMPIDPATGEQKTLDISGSYGRAVGYSMYDYYMREWAGVDPANGDALWVLNYDDLDGDGAYTEGEEISSMTEYLAEKPNANVLATTTNAYSTATQKFVGKSAIPDVRGGLNLNAGYKGINLQVLFRYQLGGYGYDNAYADLMNNHQVGQGNFHTDIRNRWQQEGDITDVPRYDNDLTQNYSSRSTRFLTKADYFTLSNVRLGYTFPQTLTQKLRIQSFDVFVAGDNLFLTTKRDGFNPTTDIQGDSNRYTYDPLTTFTLGGKIKF
ncbi:SusC/RagA family TonB-linked outer membrane protein [Flammeovirgaceae bacterium SG7u.111]|nr:SusC/RagA family TonB-linked outer membrane protein [Flammeovirgaceae bacterium SG7u.132]WPO36282.1 SusC/RagA family TonB-linked outer membrane protein [Flammeovirgaceae bacterium SG7u.111]